MKIIKIAQENKLSDNKAVLELSVTNLNKALNDLATSGTNIIGQDSINTIRNGITNNIQSQNIMQLNPANVNIFLKSLTIISQTVLRITQSLTNIQNDPQAKDLDVKIVIEEIVKGLNTRSVQFQGMLSQFNSQATGATGTITNVVK